MMTKAETDMLALTVKLLDDIINGLAQGNGYSEWSRLSDTWAEKSNPIREVLRQEEDDEAMRREQWKN